VASVAELVELALAFAAGGFGAEFEFAVMLFPVELQPVNRTPISAMGIRSSAILMSL
jgi:hypothetical protein